MTGRFPAFMGKPARAKDGSPGRKPWGIVPHVDTKPRQGRQKRHSVAPAGACLT